MKTLKIIGLALAICSLLLTPCVFAQLAVDAHIAKEIVDPDGNTLVSAYVSIDSLSYNSGNGTVDLSGTFYVHNYDPKRDINYDGDLRLEITARTVLLASLIPKRLFLVV